MKNVFIITNTSCNQCCNYCYYNIGVEKKINGLLNSDNLKKFLDCKVDKISITGGEPLINPDLFKYLKIARKHTKKIVLSTNGLLITRNLVKRLISNGINKFFVSLDQIDGEYHDKFRSNSKSSALAAIQILLLNNCDVSVTSVITTKNISKIFDLQRFCNNNNIKFWPQPVFIPAYNKKLCDLNLANIKKDKWKKIIEEIPENMINTKAAKFLLKYFELFIKADKSKYFDCGFGSDQMVINVDGSIKACFHGPQLGNINNNKLSSWRWEKIRNNDCFSEACFQYYL